MIIEDHGRTPGIQQNDASETFAVLQSLLNTHTVDDIELYCDIQGCAARYRLGVWRCAQEGLRSYVEQDR